MSKIIRLTESDLVRLVKKVVREEQMVKKEPKEQVDYMSSDLTTVEAIYTMIGTVIGLLGVSGGFKMLGDLISGLPNFSELSITITEALGTLTPTSITVVPTII